MTTMHKVFVYGSLKAGFHNHRRLGVGSRLIGLGETVARDFNMVNLGCYPGVCRVEHGGTTIKGEVYAATEKILASLDHLEGHPHYYRREPVEIAGGCGECWMYILNPKNGQPTERVITSGNWGCHLFGQGIACDCGPCQSMQAALESEFA